MEGRTGLLIPLGGLSLFVLAGAYSVVADATEKTSGKVFIGLMILGIIVILNILIYDWVLYTTDHNDFDGIYARKEYVDGTTIYKGIKIDTIKKKVYTITSADLDPSTINFDNAESHDIANLHGHRGYLYVPSMRLSKNDGSAFITGKVGRLILKDYIEVNYGGDGYNGKIYYPI
jgi:hypothetical protein